MELHKYLHVNDFICFWYDSTRCFQWHSKRYLSCSTIEAAIDIQKLLIIIPSSTCALTANAKGIWLQSAKRACPFSLVVCLAQYLQQHFMVESWGTYVYTHIKKMYVAWSPKWNWRQCHCRTQWCWEYVSMKATITQFIYVWLRGKMHVFFGATYYYLYRSLKMNGIRSNTLSNSRGRKPMWN
jgi:hypothetical protein